MFKCLQVEFSDGTVCDFLPVAIWEDVIAKCLAKGDIINVKVKYID